MSEPQPSPRQQWDDRYADEEYRFGTEPNDFLRDELARVAPDGASLDVLCLADGEGRNGVFLAQAGHRVTSVDLSANGMAKARRLAEARGVAIETVVADLGSWDLGADRWDLAVSIFFHSPPPVRARVMGTLATALRPGGHLLLESYTPDQVGRGTGGPPVRELAMTLDILHRELIGLEILHGQELERPVIEGPGHTGIGAVVQVIARRPS